jgi:uncharacterized membrane protein YphA (DoxX/SURF4 family)
MTKGGTVNVVLWILAGLLAVAFLAAGTMKLTQPKEKLVGSGMGAMEDYSPRAIKTIGLLEVLAAIGLVLPAALTIVPVLVPIAAVGLVALMFGAVLTHARRRESQAIVVNILLLAMALVVAWGRLGPHSFAS